MSTSAQQPTSPIHVDVKARVAGIKTTYTEPSNGRTWDFAAAANPTQYVTQCLAVCSTQSRAPIGSNCSLPQVSVIVEKDRRTGKDALAMQCMFVGGGFKADTSTHQYKFGVVRNGTLPWMGATSEPVIKNGTVAKECFDECNTMPNCWAANYFGSNTTCLQYSSSGLGQGRWWVWELDPAVTIPAGAKFGDLGAELKQQATAMAATVPSGAVGIAHEGALVQMVLVLVTIVVGAML